MTMSRDRIEFTWGDRICGDQGARDAFKDVFDQNPPNIGDCGPVRIRCRPSQFVRFLVLRNKHGGHNDFKILNAKIVDEVASTLDLSKVPAEYAR